MTVGESIATHRKKYSKMIKTSANGIFRKNVILMKLDFMVSLALQSSDQNVDIGGVVGFSFLQQCTRTSNEQQYHKASFFIDPTAALKMVGGVCNMITTLCDKLTTTNIDKCVV